MKILIVMGSESGKP